MRFNKLYKPNKEFHERTRTVFLAAFREKFPAGRPAVSPSFAYFMRGLAVGISGILVFMSASVYADQQNVGPDNILYPLKRSQEWLNLTLSSEVERPAFHLKLAERRLQEIQSVREGNPQSPRIVGLTAELREEVKRSLPTIENFDVDQAGVIHNGDAGTSSSSTETTEAAGGTSEEKDNEGKFVAPSQSQPPAAAVSSGSGPAVFPAKNNDLRDVRTGATSTKLRIDAPLSGIRAETSTSDRGKSGDSALPSAEKKRARICLSWKNLLESEFEEVRAVVADRPDFSQSFKEQCAPTND